MIFAKNKSKAHLKQIVEEKVSVLVVRAVVRGLIFGLFLWLLGLFVEEVYKFDYIVLAAMVMTLFTFLMDSLERFFAAQQLK